MTIANMRANGVRWIMLACPAPCHHIADIPADDLPEFMPVIDVGRRYRCSACGRKGPESRPAWHIRGR
jgi:hypothetical protein